MLVGAPAAGAACGAANAKHPPDPVPLPPLGRKGLVRTPRICCGTLRSGVDDAVRPRVVDVKAGLAAEAVEAKDRRGWATALLVVEVDADDEDRATSSELRSER